MRHELIETFGLARTLLCIATVDLLHQLYDTENVSEGKIMYDGQKLKLMQQISEKNYTDLKNDFCSSFRRRDCPSNLSSGLTILPFSNLIPSSTSNSIGSPRFQFNYYVPFGSQNLMVAASLETSEDRGRSTANIECDASETSIYDFVVIGNGIVGRAAIETLQRECPGATVALIDPLRAPEKHIRWYKVGKNESKEQYLSSANVNLKVCYFPLHAARFDPLTKVVVMKDTKILPNASVSTDSEKIDQVDPNFKIQYRHGVLIATGARGAPPPYYIFDENVRTRILELRPTFWPQHFNNKKQQPYFARRVFESPEALRKQVLCAAAEGQRIGVLGSGWEAMDLVVAASIVSKRGTRPLLIFGSSGPLSNVLPPYLSLAVTQRLKAKRIEVQDRSLVNYAAESRTELMRNNTAAGDEAEQNQYRMQIYTTKVHDSYDTDMAVVDQIVVAPETSGTCGSAVIPTASIPQQLLASANNRSWHQAWSFLARPQQSIFSKFGLNVSLSPLACYEDDGRIAVNSELCACSGVYAAGSVARYANTYSGHTDVAGVGIEDGTTAGYTAAMNMSRSYRVANMIEADDSQLDAKKSSKHMNAIELVPLIKNPVPVFRSDVRSDGSPSSLQTYGIHALCVGNCKADSFATHAFWWTNQSAQSRLLKLMEKDDVKTVVNIEQSETLSDEKDHNELLRRRKSIQAAMKPVYGIGVIYYIDASGRVEGVMTWGLPYSVSGSDQKNVRHCRKLNNELVDFLRRIVLITCDSNFNETRNDNTSLTMFLKDMSCQIVSFALAKEQGNDEDGRFHQLDGDLEAFPKPLHRQTEVRPPTIRTGGVLKRKGKGQSTHGMLGEGLFVRFENSTDDVSLPVPPELSKHVGFAAHNAQYMYEQNVVALKEGRWEDNDKRARPPKEDQIWQRKDEIDRYTSVNEMRLAAFKAAIGLDS